MDELKGVWALAIFLLLTTLTFMFLYSAERNKEIPQTECTYEFSEDTPPDLTDHCRYMFLNSSGNGFSLIFRNSSFDCNPEVFKNRCIFLNGTIAVNGAYADVFPGAIQFRATQNGKVSTLNHYECDIRT